MSILYIILAALALGILVFIHELGHYFAAKKMGMVVEIFSIGFGKPLIKWRWNQVDWQLGWIPFGGYVKIAGMELGKKEKQEGRGLHEIPNGFFSKSPLKRIVVAAAGPLSNFVLALLLFSALWFMGGREKPFSEFTQIVGWVDPSSEIYAKGVRPGDIIKTYDGNKVTGSKDLLYAAMLGDKHVEFSGYHMDYETGTKKPFQYVVESYPAPNALSGILTTGILSSAHYLIYSKFSNGQPNPLPEGSPMEGSGIQDQDRLIWCDGEILFSLEQLSHLLKEEKALLTVERKGDIFLTRQPRVFVTDLAAPQYVRHEWEDWQYEAKIKGRIQDIKIIPYVINGEGYIERALPFIDEETKLFAFPEHLYATQLEMPLEAGDRILAVDGEPVRTGYQILKQLQKRQVQLIVQEKVPLNGHISWKIEDREFEKQLDVSAIQAIASTIGTRKPLKEYGSFKLLNPVEPKLASAFTQNVEATAQIKQRIEAQREEINKIRDQEKRRRALKYFEQVQHQPLLGLHLQDRSVNYNPDPFYLLGSVTAETGQTLKALVMGNLHPKWLSGPIGIVRVIHHGWQLGIGEALFWIAAISLNLGILNLLPIPVLDGGYICISLWELITRRPLKAKTMEKLIIPFVILLVGLLIFLTFQDISRLFN